MPKTLIPVREHEPLLFYLLSGLKRAGVDQLLVVTGYRHADVQSYVGERWQGSDVAFIRNTRYASWGNFHSVRLAVDQSPGYDLLVVNSDVVVHPDVYQRTVETMGDVVIAVERRRNLDQEDMRVELANDRVRAIGKDLDRGKSHGEYCGVSLLRPDGARLYSQISTDAEWRAETDVYYEDVYARMLGRADTRASEVRAGEYAEVDEPGDMAAAARVIDAHHEAWGDVAAQPEPQPEARPEARAT